MGGSGIYKKLQVGVIMVWNIDAGQGGSGIAKTKNASLENAGRIPDPFTLKQILPSSSILTSMSLGDLRCIGAFIKGKVLFQFTSFFSTFLSPV